jgi:DNA repair exonuclease SbcCD nuclease subunit
MKIAIINDTHFGVRNDSPFFLEQSLNFFENTFFPYLKEHNITNVIHLGDLLDRRKFVNFNTLSQVRKRFFKPLIDNNIKTYITIGNHDTYYKNTNSLNSINELFFNESDVINIIETPTVVDYDGLCIGIVPWVTKDNEADCLNFIKKCKCPIVGGHFEISGFHVMNGVIHPSGLNKSIFDRFELVLSGHFHLKQNNGNIHYLGTQYELNFGDMNSPKGFHILDTKTRDIEFIKNPNKLFHLIKYDDATEAGVDFILNENLNKYKNGFIKVIVTNKIKPFAFDKFIDALYSLNPQQLTIVEEYKEKQNIIDIDITEDTMSIINKEIDNLENVQDKTKLKIIIKDLYMESLTS